MENPIVEVKIPHKHAIEGEGDVVPVNFLLPPGASEQSPAPCVLIITGLDGYRTELAVWQQGFLQKGVATVIAEIPGTGDSPALRQDPTSPDRQWSSVLDWIDTQKAINNKKIIVWGFSTGGYYALRVAHTHHDRLFASISLGGGCHHVSCPSAAGYCDTNLDSRCLTGNGSNMLTDSNILSTWQAHSHTNLGIPTLNLSSKKLVNSLC